MATPSMTSDMFNRAALSNQKNRAGGTGLSTGGQLGLSRGGQESDYAKKQQLSMAKSLARNSGISRDKNRPLEQKLRGQAGKRIGQAAGAALSSYVPVLGTAVGGAIGGFIGRVVGESILGKILLCLFIASICFLLFLILVTTIAVFKSQCDNLSWFSRMAASWYGLEDLVKFCDAIKK